MGRDGGERVRLLVPPTEQPQESTGDEIWPPLATDLDRFQSPVASPLRRSGGLSLS